MALVRLETGGLVCPFPLIDAKNKMAELEIGDELLIRFDCTQATESIPNWAAENGYPVTRFEQVGDASWEIVVQKQ
ncbi:sulfurtransferase TusA family protein [Streptococcus sciuri]|uniref:Sulfurtransferase TusA family protein n=1 Tax=Streptococcus sciuri TaxID=2973939 RepID=A0ABT2F9C4_9STRE|nr:sulfurtransferase TusA family protein [Streptococcus sciuri]MCS4488818.1 sulfurtransferase TusA family protein [Streptococcus sciuri]